MAGRNVGSIEVTVEANTGKLRAQIIPSVKRIGDEAGQMLQDGIEDGLNDVSTTRMRTTLKAQIKILSKELEQTLESMDPEVHIDTREAEAEIQRLRGQLEALSDETIEVVLDPDTERFRAALFDAVAEAEAAQLEIEKADIQWKIDMNSALAIAEAEAIAAEIDDLEAQIKVDADTKAATLALFGFKERTERERIEWEVDVDTLAANIKLDRMRLEEQANALGLDVEMDLTEANLRLALFRREQAANAVNIPVDLDGGGTGGGGGGGGRGGLFKEGFIPQEIQQWVPLVTSSLNTIAVAVEGLASGAIQVLSSAFSALGGAAGGLIPIMAGLGATFAAVGIGMIGVTGAMGAVTAEFKAATEEGRAFNFAAEDIQKALAGLAPEARNFVKAFSEIFPLFQEIQRTVSGHLFAGLDAELRSLAQETIPDIGRSLTLAADVANRFFKGLADAAKGIDFAGTFAALTPALDALGRAIASVVSSIEPFLKSAAPAARELAQWIEQGAARMLELARSGQESGALGEFFREGVDSLKQWGSLIAETSKALFTLFEAGKSGGDGMIASLTDIIAKFNEWMRSVEGQRSLQTFFENGRRILSALVPVLEGLKDAFVALVPPDAIGQFEELARNVGNVLPVLAEFASILGQTGALTKGFSLSNIVQALSQIADALRPVLPALRQLSEAMEQGVSQALRALQPLLNAAGQALGALAEAVTPLVQMIGSGLARVLEQAAPLFRLLGDGIRDIAKAIQPMLPTIGKLIDELVKVAAVLLKAWTPLIANNIETIVAAIELLGPVLELVVRLLTPLLRLFGLLATIVGTVEGALTGLSTGALTAVADAFGFIIDKVNEFLDLLSSVPILGDVLDFIGITSGSDEITASLNLTNQAVEATGNGFGIFGGIVDKAADSMTNGADAAASMPPTLEDIAVAAGMTAKSFQEFDTAMQDAMDPVLGIQGPMTAIEEQMLGVGKAADEAAEASDKMGEAIDRLITPALDAESALSDQRAAVDDLKKSLEENGKSLDLNSEAGRGNREAIRESIDAITAYGQAAIAGGDDAAHVTQSLNDMRAELVNQVAAFTGSQAAAEAYVNQLGLTPESITTIVNTPGLLEATNSVLGYDLDLDGIADNVDTAFSASNLEIVKARLSEYGVDLSNVPDEVLTAYLTQNFDAAKGQATDLSTTMTDITNNPAVASVTAEGVDATNTAVASVGTNMGELDSKTAKPTVELTNNLIVLAVISTINSELSKLNAATAKPDVSIPNFGLVVGQTAVMMALVRQLDTTDARIDTSVPGFATVAGQLLLLATLVSSIGRSVSVSVSAPGLDDAINDFRTLNSLITQVNGRVATVTTRNVTINSTQQGMAGTLITHPMNMNVGERGLREALIPLDLPLSRVDPSVRDMASLLRGDSSSTPVTAGTILRQVNVTNHIEVTSQSADPVAVATQVMNRAAATAN